MIVVPWPCRDCSQLEAKGDHLKVAHAKSVTKVRKTVDKLETQLKEKQAENDRLERRRRELEESVAMRESILATRAAGKTSGDAAAPNDRLKVRHTASCVLVVMVHLGSLPGMITLCSRCVVFGQAVTTRRKLVELAKSQTEEIDFLRKELERLRQRTFPSFAVVASKPV